MAKRALNRYAQPNPKLKRDQLEIIESETTQVDIPSSRSDTSKVEYVLSIIMFFAPRVYFREFKTTNDNILIPEEWVPIFNSLRDDWQQVVINVRTVTVTLLYGP